MVAPPYGTKQPYRAKAEALASSDAVALALHRLSVESRPAASSALTPQPAALHDLTKLLRMLSRNHRLLFSLVADSRYSSALSTTCSIMLRSTFHS